MKSTSTTEQQMRDETAPSPKTTAELSEYIDSLLDRKHDYGTCVYAMSLAATAAFNMVAGKLGVTGFQASCADMDILTRTRMLKGPWMILKAEDALFPQSNPMEKAREAVTGWQEWLAGEAKKKLAQGGRAHPDVLEHWRDLAYPWKTTLGDDTVIRAEITAKADFLRNDFTPEFVEKNADSFRRFGIDSVYFYEDIATTLADSCEDGASWRFGMPVSLTFHRDIAGIKTSWSIDTEKDGSNGSDKLNIDFQKLETMETIAEKPEVKSAIAAYIARAKAKLSV